jgi:hypothetical protein
MELKELIKILKKNKRIFWAIWLGVILLTGLVYFWLNSNNPYQASFSIDLGRSEQGRGVKYSAEYDHYYHLEADEIFAQRLSDWLQNPSTVKEILVKAEQPSSKNSLKNLEGFFETSKTTSGQLEVTFSSFDSENVPAIFETTQQVLQSKTDRLNQNLQKQGWFQLIFSQPVIASGNYPPSPFLVFSLAGGLFLATLGALIGHYWKEV